MFDDSLLVRAYRGEKTERAPIWLMRQAGRYLPEYREIRAKNSMLDVIRTPELALRVTLQPIERFRFDAAIIFADILTPLIGMGIELDFVQGEGPCIGNPVRTLADIEKLAVPPPEENVGYTLRAIALASQALAVTSTPLIGFSGAPFTLTCYLCDQGDLELGVTREVMLKEPRAWSLLQEKLVRLVAEYLVAQVDAGAAAVQIFDSWAGVLSPEEFEKYSLPYLQSIVRQVRARTKVPIVYFATNSKALLPALKGLPVDAFGVDWRVRLIEANEILGQQFALQGNLSPKLFCEAWEPIADEARLILEEGRRLRGFVFNLGHGILPATPLENVEKLVQLVKGIGHA